MGGSQNAGALKILHKILFSVGHWRLTPVNLATQEVEIRRITVESQPWQTILETLSRKKSITKWLVEWLKV
jgi:hypothetical protein